MATKTNTTTPVVEEEDERAKYVNKGVSTVEANQNKIYDDTVTAINNQNAATKSAAKATAEKQIADANARYRRQYDANAIQEVLDRNTLDERMANMGLSNSGLNATQQTAIALARGNRDASTTANRNQFIADTELALQDVYNQSDAAAAESKLAANKERITNIDNARLGYEEAYNEMQQALYDQQQETQKQQNELTLSIAKKLISEGKTEEALALLAGANGNGTGETSTPTVDKTKIPYHQRVYKKVSNSDWDWLGGEDEFYDPIDNRIYGEDELMELIRRDGAYSEDKLYGDIEDTMDAMSEESWGSPDTMAYSDESLKRVSGLRETVTTDDGKTKEVLTTYGANIAYSIISSDKMTSNAKKEALNNIGFTEAEITEMFNEFGLR